jgi:cytochrome c oxidase subunit 4
MSRRVVTTRTYFFVWGGLLGLTLANSLIALIDLGQFSLIVPLIVAAMKAGLIAAVFMHAVYEMRLVRVIVAGGVVWFLILLSLTLGDYITRGWLPVPGK